MRDERKWWKAAAVLGVAAIALAVAGCSDRGSGAVEDFVEIPEVVADDSGQGSEALPAADPASAADEEASVADEHDAIIQKIDELFAQLTAETEENAKLLEMIGELKDEVEKLECQVVILSGHRMEVRSSRTGVARYVTSELRRLFHCYNLLSESGDAATARPPRPVPGEERPAPAIHDYADGPRLELYQPEAELPARPARSEL